MEKTVVVIIKTVNRVKTHKIMAKLNNNLKKGKLVNHLQTKEKQMKKEKKEEEGKKNKETKKGKIVKPPQTKGKKKKKEKTEEERKENQERMMIGKEEKKK